MDKQALEDQVNGMIQQSGIYVDLLDTVRNILPSNIVTELEKQIQAGNVIDFYIKINNE